MSAGIALVCATASCPVLSVVSRRAGPLPITSDRDLRRPDARGAPFVQLPVGVPDSAAVLELPLGDVGADIAAVYSWSGHGHRVVNGYSGYSPPHYEVLRAGLAERDDSALTALTGFAPIVVVIQPQRDPDGAWAAFAAAHAGAVPLASPDGQLFYLLPAAAAAALGRGAVADPRGCCER